MSNTCSCCASANQATSTQTASAGEESTAARPAVDSVSSRVFSRRATLLTGAVASTAVLASCAEGGTKVTAPDGTVDMAAASSVEVGKSAKLTRGTTTIIVTQPTKGDYKAYSPVCTHQGCQLQVQDSTRIVCPCHGSEFAPADGSVIHGPAETPLKTYPVQVKDGRIFVTSEG